jgi:hypothetical protein
MLTHCGAFAALQQMNAHTHNYAQFCTEEVELFGSYADLIVHFHVLPPLLHINCSVVTVGKAERKVKEQQTVLAQDLSAIYMAAGTSAAVEATAAAVPDIFVLNDQHAEHYSVLLPRAQKWANGERLDRVTFSTPY